MDSWMEFRMGRFAKGLCQECQDRKVEERRQKEAEEVTDV
jgi:hypothetical protein